MIQQTARLFFSSFVILSLFYACKPKDSAALQLYPQPEQKAVNVDTHLKITFDTQPEIGTSGLIRIYEQETDTLVDVLDLSIPPGPTEPRKNPEATYTQTPYQYAPATATNANTKPGTPSGTAAPNSDEYQLTIIGGFTDAFHFYPIIIHDTTAIINLHHNLLEYDTSYYVLVDSTVLKSSGKPFKGVYDKNQWTFTTKTQKPDLATKRLVVDHKGTGDFNTLQGAVDFIPDFHQDSIKIFVKEGIYEDLIYFRNKTNISISGADQKNTIIQYANNEVFNPHPEYVKTNEWPGTFPSRRAAFAIDNCENIQLHNLTIKTLLKGQAEGLLINGNKILVKDVSIVGDGDALQTNGPAYFENVTIDGGGDMILGRGPAFFKSCEFYSPGPFMWVRNTEENHGNVFVNCSFTGTRTNGSEIARAPDNKGYNYPNAEAVLINCYLDNIIPEGWGAVGEAKDQLHYWEYNSRKLKDSTEADVSQRASYAKQLQLPEDQQLITDYQNPKFILEGWTPKVF